MALDALTAGFGRLQNALFPTDPSLGVDPNLQRAAQGQAIFQLGLGMLSGTNPGQAYAGASQNFAGAMDNAFKHTLIKRQQDQEQQDREHALKVQQQQDRQSAAVTANRVLSSMANPQYAQNPSSYWDLVKNQPEVQDALKQLGVQAPSYTGAMADPNQFAAFQQQLGTAAGVNAAPQAPIKLGAGEGVFLPGPTPTSPMTQIGGQPAKRTVEWKDDGKQLVPVFSDTGERVPTLNPIPKQLTPDQSRQTFSDQSSALLASLAAKGISLPVGLRSKEQMTSTLNGLLSKFPALTPDEIADKIAGGQIDFGAAKKETTTAAAQAGRVAIATNELNTFAPLVLQASAAVDRTRFVPINKLLQMGESAISDPQLKQLKIAVTSMLNAYDQLASRGGTDVKKREEAHSLLTTADSPEALTAAVAMFQKEAQAAGQAAADATKYRAPGEAPRPSAPVDAVNALVAHPELRDQFKAKYGYLPSGF